MVYRGRYLGGGNGYWVVVAGGDPGYPGGGFALVFKCFLAREASGPLSDWQAGSGPSLQPDLGQWL